MPSGAFWGPWRWGAASGIEKALTGWELVLLFPRGVRRPHFTARKCLHNPAPQSPRLRSGANGYYPSTHVRIEWKLMWEARSLGFTLSCPQEIRAVAILLQCSSLLSPLMQERWTRSQTILRPRLRISSDLGKYYQAVATAGLWIKPPWDGVSHHMSTTKAWMQTGGRDSWPCSEGWEVPRRSPGIHCKGVGLPTSLHPCHPCLGPWSS